MGYKNKLVAHGLLALASTTLNDLGHDPDVIEAALAHVDKNEVRRALICYWSQHIENSANGITSNQDNIKHLKVV